MKLDRRTCGWLSATAAMLLCTAAAGADRQHRVACPLEAPAEWGLPNPAPLRQAAVLAQPTGQAIDDSAPPSLVPDRGYATGHVWHNVWIMGDEPHWSHFVD